eukprot:8716373-Lingulodinium_polyedra.AAC.1
MGRWLRTCKISSVNSSPKDGARDMPQHMETLGRQANADAPVGNSTPDDENAGCRQWRGQ